MTSSRADEGAGVATEEQVRRHDEVLRQLGPKRVRERLDFGRWRDPNGWRTMRAEAYLEEVGGVGAEAPVAAPTDAGPRPLIRGLAFVVVLASLVMLLLRLLGSG